MRYVPHTQADILKMLDVIGAPGIEALFDDIPREVYQDNAPDWPAMDEAALTGLMGAMAARNTAFKARFLGAGVYRHFIPAVVRQLAGRPEFVTAYTPYQPEISQGVLQAIYEYQTSICELTGMAVSNASMYDGATAACEAALLCHAMGRGGAVAVSELCHPHIIETLSTYLTARGVEMRMIPAAGRLTGEGNAAGSDASIGTAGSLATKAAADAAATPSDALTGMTSPSDVAAAAQGACCVIAQCPNFLGSIEDMGALADAAHGANAQFVAVVNPMTLGVLRAPGEYGADIAVGDGQPLGLPPSFGGPGFGFLTAKAQLLRRIPGRIVGKTHDAKGRIAYVLTLQAREQHIRREKAMSNICSNHSLCAVTAGIYMAALGPEGIRRAGLSSMAQADKLEQLLIRHGFTRAHSAPFLNEFAMEGPVAAETLRDELASRGILAGLPLPAEGGGESRRMLWCATEMTGDDELALLDRALAEVLQ